MYSPTHLSINPELSSEEYRDEFEALMDTIRKIYGETSKENANTDPSASTRMYQIGSIAARTFNRTKLIHKRFAKAHKRGDIHIHDFDYYFTINCMTHDLARILEGFDNGVGHIRSPKKIASAMALTAIVLQSMQNNMFGGQAVGFYDKALAKYAEIEFRRQKTDIRNLLMALGVDLNTIPDEVIENVAMERTEKEVFQASEALVYNLNTMKARSGNQVPFTSFNFGTDTTIWGRMVTRNLLLAFERGLGYGESPLFPNLCFRVKAGVNMLPSDPNYDLFRLALRVASTRMHPTFAFMDSTFNAPYGDEAGYMGCRTRVMANVNGPAQINGRGNLFFTTMNLPGLTMSKQSWLEHEFFSALDERIDLIIDQLLERYNIIKNFKKKDLPFAMQYYLGSEGMGDDDIIEPAIKNGTLSMGFIGLAETLILLTGKHHGESEEAQELGKRIVAHMRKRMDEATEKYGLNFTLLATPAEGLSGRFTAIDAKRYGVIPRVTDKSYYTNSFHVPVDYECTISHKINVEAVYHEYTNAGHISYLELPYPPKDNLDGLEQVVLYMAKKNMGYAGVNFPIDHCKGCHYTGVIDSVCPKCGGTDIKRVRRITGYMSDVDKFNDAKYDELMARTTQGGKGCLG